MTERRSPDDQRPLPGGFETGNPRKKGSGKKTRRVSQRRELAIVTLGVVASITGLGGVLAANPPGWAISEAKAQSAVAARESSAPASSSSSSTRAIRPSSGTKAAAANAESTPAPDPSETAQAPVRPSIQQPVQRSVQQSTPVYSAPTQDPAAAVSQGS